MTASRRNGVGLSVNKWIQDAPNTRRLCHAFMPPCLLAYLPTCPPHFFSRDVPSALGTLEEDTLDHSCFLNGRVLQRNSLPCLFPDLPLKPQMRSDPIFCTEPPKSGRDGKDEKHSNTLSKTYLLVIKVS